MARTPPDFVCTRVSGSFVPLKACTSVTKCYRLAITREDREGLENGICCHQGLPELVPVLGLGGPMYWFVFVVLLLLWDHGW